MWVSLCILLWYQIIVECFLVSGAETQEQRTFLPQDDQQGDGLTGNLPPQMHLLNSTAYNLSSDDFISAQRTPGVDFVSKMCYQLPGFCLNMRMLKERFFQTGTPFEGRGPKDLIAIISTMLASLLGAILVKLNVLIVLSLISVGIGKLLLLMLALKTKIFAHQQTQPVLYDKVYYPHHPHPHHREYMSASEPEVNYPDEYSPYTYSR